MAISRKRSVLYLSVIGVLLLIAYSMRHIFHHMTDNALLGISMMTLRWVIHITLTVFWCLSLRRRILSRSIRRLLLSVGGLLLFWQIVRIIKYDYVIVTEAIGRYCWYSYYIPMTLVPLLGVFIIAHIGKPEGYHSPSWMKLLFIPASALIAVVMTNDFHQLVFTFHNGFERYNSDYGYGFMYIIVMGWFVVTGLYFVIMLLVKSRVPGSKSFQKLPLMIMLGAIVFWAGYSMKLYTGDLTAMDCVIIILLLESAIQSGLIPSNMHYSELFNQSTIAAQIIDHHHAVHYSSAAAEPLGEQTIQKALTQTVALGDMLLHSQPIAGGHILWQDDVKEINTLTTHLREANELLSEQVDLMKAEVELRERRLQAEEKSRLYDRIAREIAPRLHKVCGQGSKIYSPVDNPKTLMRNVLTKDAAEKLIDEVDEIETLWIKDEKQREAAYKKAIYSADCRCLLQIIKTIYLRKEERVKSGKKITATDERYFKLAEDRLYQELCVPLGLEDNYESIQMSKKNEFVALFMKNLVCFVQGCEEMNISVTII